MNPVESYTGSLSASQDAGDACDTCTVVSNTDQRDADADGYCNVCDADFIDNGIVDPTDLTFTKANVGQLPGPSAPAPWGRAAGNSQLDEMKERG